MVSASMGGGHDGAAGELAARLEQAGLQVHIADYLRALPLGLGRLFRRAYQLELRLAPWSYEAVYRMWYRLPLLRAPLVLVDVLLTGRSIRRWVAARRPAVVVSTYPLASLVLGHLRRRGQLDQPVVTVITDFGVHPLWIHPGVDLHICVHPQAAEQAARHAAGRVAVCGPLVGPGFFATRADRVATRHRLGLAADDRVVLVVAGSWGTGRVEATVRVLAGCGRYRPVTVCGRNRRLRRRLGRRGLGIALGWVDDMARLMGAADAVIENAGGLTCMEAMAAAVPVITYRPIPGHGRENARRMAQSGVTVHPGDDAELIAALDRVVCASRLREQLLRAGRAMFTADVADQILDLAVADLGTPPAARRSRPARVVVAAVALALLYAISTVGVGEAAAHGVGVAHPAKQQRNDVFLAVRPTPAALEDPRIIRLLQRLPATVVVDEPAAAERPGLIDRLAAAHLDVAFADWYAGDIVRWRRSGWAARPSGRTEVVLARRLDAVDLLFSHWTRSRMVIPRVVAAGDGSVALQPGRIYLLEPSPGGLQALSSLVGQVTRQLRAEHLTGRSCAVLQ